jgi:DNA-directed RNA polymerase specialized sigma24 family protein
VNNSLKSSVPTDREVILGILNNSEDTLNKLYKAYFAMVLQFILNNNGNEDDAKDVYQEAIIILYNKIKEGNFELSSKIESEQ